MLKRLLEAIIEGLYNEGECARKRVTGMFGKLRRRINRTIRMTSLLFTTLMAFVAFIFISLALYRNFETSAQETIHNSIRRSHFIIETVQDTTIQIAKTSSIQEALQQDGYNPKVNPILNTFKTTSHAIVGVTLYTDGGHIYSTSSISSHLTLEEMREHEPIDRFMASDEETFLSVRTSHIHRIYNHVRYLPEYGIITYIVKLKDSEARTVGYLFVDIQPQYIYSNFFDYSDYANFKAVESYIITQEGNYLPSRFNTPEHAPYLSKARLNHIVRSKDFHYLILKHDIFTEGTTVVSLVPLTPYYQTIGRIGAIFLALLFFLNTVTFFLSNAIANRIVRPIGRIYLEMQRRNKALQKDRQIG